MGPSLPPTRFPVMSNAPLSVRRRVAYAAVMVVLSLLALEGIARLVVQATPNARWEHHKNLMVDLGFPQLNDILAPHPVRFWQLQPNLNDHEVYGRIAGSRPFEFTISTDANGLRVSKHSDGLKRVLFLGDSCLFGFGVDDHQTIPSAVQDLVPSVRSVNASVPGYTAYQGRRWLEELDQLGPFDAVVVNFGRNDGLTWNDRSDVEQAGAAAQRSPLERSRLVQVLQRITPQRTPTVASSRQRPRLTDAEFGREIDSIVQWAKDRGARPILTVWPVVQQMQKDGLLPKQYTLLEAAARHQVDVINLVPVLRGAGGAELFLDVVHTNATGCHAVAREISNLLR